MRENINVLIVDPSVTNKCLYTCCLSKIGEFICNVSHVHKGKEALELLEQKDINLFIVFDKLPDMSGEEVIAKIRQSKKHKITPLVMSTEDFDEHREKSLIEEGSYECLYLNNSSLREISRIIRYAYVRKSLQEKLSLQETQIFETMRFKANFFAVMNHEMRSPLNGMLGMTDLLWESDLTAEQREWVNVFIKAGEHILNIINTIFEVNKIEAGIFEVETNVFDLKDHVEEIFEKMHKKAQEKGLELTLVFDEGTPTYLKGDIKELRNVITDLIDNSIKFSDKGTIELKVGPDRRKERKGGVLFAIKDQGIGIAKEHQEFIFESYTQIDDAVTRKFGGVGLGLRMAKEVVRRMGGKIWMKSQLNKGSVFYFTINLEPFEVEVNEDTKRKLLIVDDEEDAREVMEMMLEENYDLLQAGDGKEGLEVLTGNSDVDLVITDMNMPGMDGAEMIARMSEGKMDVPAIFLTGYKNKEMSGTAERFGVSDILEKPLDEEQVNKIVQRVITRNVLNKANKEEAEGSEVEQVKDEALSEDEKKAA